MKNIIDFLSAALPWISIGLLLAIFFAQSARREKDRKRDTLYANDSTNKGALRKTVPDTETVEEITP